VCRRDLGRVLVELVGHHHHHDERSPERVDNVGGGLAGWRAGRGARYGSVDGAGHQRRIAPATTSLVTKDLVVGTGAEASASSTVLVQYVGAAYTTGKVFDSSWQRGQPLSFSLSGVVPGFAQGIEGMKVGGRRVIVIPPALGYGAAGEPPVIAANETLVFVVDLKSVS